MMCREESKMCLHTVYIDHSGNRELITDCIHHSIVNFSLNKNIYDAFYGDSTECMVNSFSN